VEFYIIYDSPELSVDTFRESTEGKEGNKNIIYSYALFNIEAGSGCSTRPARAKSIPFHIRTSTYHFHNYIVEE
jgi:hypothetical protein